MEITITYKARCKDCKYLQQVRNGKQKRHKCNNPKSAWYQRSITLRDYVCDNWIMEGLPDESTNEKPQ